MQIDLLGNIFLMKRYGEANNERRNKAGNTDSTLKARNLTDSELISMTW